MPPKTLSLFCVANSTGITRPNTFVGVAIRGGGIANYPYPTVTIASISKLGVSSGRIRGSGRIAHDRKRQCNTSANTPI